MKGIGASKGIGLGKVFIKEELPEVKKEKIEDVDEAIRTLKNSIQSVSKAIEALYEEKLETLGKEDAQIFKAHEMIINDPELFDKIANLIRNENYSPAYAITVAIDEFVKMFENMENEYFRERALDMKDVGKRLIGNVLGFSDQSLKTIDEKTIIVAKDLTPSDTAQLNEKVIQGIITAEGGNTSHSAIIARTIGIPAIMGVENIKEVIRSGDYAIIDGSSGEVMINPEASLIKEYQKKKISIKEREKDLKSLIGVETKTKDGKIVELSANIAGLKDLENALKFDAEGVGLFRSEFIYMERNQLPTESEQYEIYKEALEKLGEKPMIIRTMDIGGDKAVDYLNFKKEMNPFLGYRAIRYCLDHTEVFKTQLKALYRASIHGKLKIMFPMVSSLKELRAIKSILKEVKSELNHDNIPFSKEVEIGIMIEIPSAAIMADKLAKAVDFFSIGTNDLIQYMTATDRMNSRLNHLYTPYHPGVLRVINDVIKKAHNEGIWVGMCGSVAGNQNLIPLLLGMGLDEFSMSPSSILESRALINKSSIKNLKPLVNAILDAEDADEVKKFLEITH
ncbi:MAG TPA: phosphoenolpyruvate--protein phosphotransferase [Clostridia bacterium]|nr:phosphoenolpyruvate--protein phosphotransferase [Clostridia bacterium]